MTVTIVGEFDGGGFVREVDDANPISGPGQYADLVESAVREGAAYHGLCDFVYRPTVVEKGNARRELSDGLVIAGGIALVLQIKSREPTAAASNTQERERSWLPKNAETARRQVVGTVRAMRSAAAAEFVNARGRRLPVTLADLKVHGVVVLDHPSCPSDFLPASHDAAVPALCLCCAGTGSSFTACCRAPPRSPRTS